MNARDVAYGQIRAALAVVLQASKTLDEDHNVRGKGADLTQPEWRHITAHLHDVTASLERAGLSCVLAMNILTDSEMEDPKCQ